MMTENQKLEKAVEVPDSQPPKLDVTSVIKDANEFEKISKEEKRRVEKPAVPVVACDKEAAAEDLNVSVDSIPEILAYEETVLADEVVVSKSIEKKDSEAIAAYGVAATGQKLEEEKVAAADIQKEANAGAVAERSKSAKKSMVTTTGFIQGRITKESALRSYNQKNYQQALQEFNKLYAQDSNNDTLVYYRAMCFYQLESYPEAIVGLETISKNSASKFYFDAQWYYALTLIEIGQKDKAESLLEIISKGSSPYKDLASQKLNQYK
jgi:tetratricopeptide (TPR) repeat protein